MHSQHETGSTSEVYSTPYNKRKRKVDSSCGSCDLEPEVAAASEIENWRSKGGQKTKCRKYLGNRKDEIADCLKWRQNRHIPLLRNGICLNLQPPVVNYRPVTAINTCAFDSLCQSILIATTDFAHVKEMVSRKSSLIHMFILIKEMVEKGIVFATVVQWLLLLLKK